MLVNFRKGRVARIKDEACYSKNSLHYLGYINNKENKGLEAGDDACLDLAR